MVETPVPSIVPRRIYLNACREIAEAVGGDGYKFVASELSQRNHY
jgi:hypothetical protein